MKLLNVASDWNVSADIKTSLQFPVHIIQTEKRPDIVAWSDSKKSVLLIELTVPWEENREEAHEWRKNRYETLRADWVEKGWMCPMIPIEVGCRGSLGNSVILFLSKIGITGSSLKIAANPLRATAQVGFGQKREVFSKNEMHVTSRNGCRKRVITSTAESKHVFLKNYNCSLKMKMNVQCDLCS